MDFVGRKMPGDGAVLHGFIAEMKDVLPELSGGEDFASIQKKQRGIDNWRGSPGGCCRPVRPTELGAGGAPLRSRLGLGRRGWLMASLRSPGVGTLSMPDSRSREVLRRAASPPGRGPDGIHYCDLPRPLRPRGRRTLTYSGTRGTSGPKGATWRAPSRALGGVILNHSK